MTPQVLADYADPPAIGAHQCGEGCLLFVPDDGGTTWGRCALRKISVTVTMRPVLRIGERDCFMSSEGDPPP